MATLGLIIPPMVVTILIAGSCIGYRDNELVQRVFKGLRPAVVGLIVTVVPKLWGTTMVDLRSILVALLVVAVVVVGLHPILAVVGGGVLGLLFWRRNRVERDNDGRRYGSPTKRVAEAGLTGGRISAVRLSFGGERPVL